MNIVNVGYDSANYYILDTPKGKLLIDSGWPGTLPKYLAQLKRKGIATGEIKYLLVTHFHPDHAGLTQELKNLNAQLILLESQVDFIDPLEDLFREKNISYVPIRKDDNLLLKFGQSRKFLAGLGLDGEILSTPGHSDDSITLITDEGQAFTGDLTSPVMIPEGSSPARTSWDKIHQHTLRRIYPGHGS